MTWLATLAFDPLIEHTLQPKLVRLRVQLMPGPLARCPAHHDTNIQVVRPDMPQNGFVGVLALQAMSAGEPTCLVGVAELARRLVCAIYTGMGGTRSGEQNHGHLELAGKLMKEGASEAEVSGTEPHVLVLWIPLSVEKVRDTVYDEEFETLPARGAGAKLFRVFGDTIVQDVAEY